jgi:hypothetical protein
MSVYVDVDGNGLWDKKFGTYDSASGLTLAEWDALANISDFTGDLKPDVDLLDDTSSAVINGAIFSHNIIGAGTGNFNDFLGVQANSDPEIAGTEHGFNGGNTDGSNSQIKTSQNFTQPNRDRHG